MQILDGGKVQKRKSTYIHDHKNTFSRYGNYFRGKYPISPNYFIPSNNRRITQALLLGYSCLLGLYFCQSMKKKGKAQQQRDRRTLLEFYYCKKIFTSLSFSSSSFSLLFFPLYIIIIERWRNFLSAISRRAALMSWSWW